MKNATLPWHTVSLIKVVLIKTAVITIDGDVTAADVDDDDGDDDDDDVMLVTCVRACVCSITTVSATRVRYVLNVRPR